MVAFKTLAASRFALKMRIWTLLKHFKVLLLQNISQKLLIGFVSVSRRGICQQFSGVLTINYIFKGEGGRNHIEGNMGGVQRKSCKINLHLHKLWTRKENLLKYQLIKHFSKRRNKFQNLYSHSYLHLFRCACISSTHIVSDSVSQRKFSAI